MIPRIKSIQPLDIFVLLVEFDGGEKVLYDVKDDIRTLVDFRVLETKMLFVRCFYLSDAQHPPVYLHLCNKTRCIFSMINLFSLSHHETQSDSL